ncbi:MAG: bifunctional DNA primase/polymerase [Cyanophyceae cyanobacterium]
MTKNSSKFAEADWQFVPIRQGSKKPIGQGWTDNGLQWADLPALGSRHQGSVVGGYGVLFGPQSGGLAGLDIDGLAASEMVDRWGIQLPTTAQISSGRPGRCLLLFRVPESYWSQIQTTSKYRNMPPTMADGLQLLEKLERTLDPPDLKVRENALRQARVWIERVGAAGGIDPCTQRFPRPFPPGSDVRIDIEVI